MASPDNIRRVFQEAFSAADIAQPLPSFDSGSSSEQVRTALTANAWEVAGVRTGGLVSGFVELHDLASESCGQHARTITDSLSVAGNLPLAPLVLRLKAQPRLFVEALGQISGIVGRVDLQRPAGRMWLFGMVTLLEQRFSRLIAEHCPGESWQQFLSAGRLQKAQELLAERRRRDQSLALADCLQFSDKTTIIARNEQLRSLTRFTSRSQVEEIGKQLERLRNNLAHAQDLIPDNWDTIVALAEQFDSVLDGPAAGAERAFQ